MKASLSAMIAVVLLFVAVAFSAENAPPTFPRDLKLSSGASLRNVSVLRWEKDRVIVKHQGGTDPVYFRHIAEPDRARVIAVQAHVAKETARRKVTKSENQPSKDRVYRGQVFISTIGGENVKLGSVRVRAFPLNYLSNFEHRNSQVIDLPAPLATVVTDADGRFSLTVPGSEPFFIFAQSGRYIGRRGRGYVGETESYDWRLPVSEIEDPENVLLSNRNLVKSFTVKIAEEN